MISVDGDLDDNLDIDAFKLYGNSILIVINNYSFNEMIF